MDDSKNEKLIKVSEDDNENNELAFMDLDEPDRVADTNAESDSTDNDIEQQKLKKKVRRLRRRCWLLFALFIVFTGGLVFLLYNLNEENEYLEEKAYTCEEKYVRADADAEQAKAKVKKLRKQLDEESENFESYKTKVSKKFPIIINDIKIANVNSYGNNINDFGSYIYASNAYYLKLKIFYTGLTADVKQLEIRWINSYGYCFYNETVTGYLYYGEDKTYVFNGMGRDYSGYWSRGNYRVEIWCDDVCLGMKRFTLY